jgi:hypothetical protein
MEAVARSPEQNCALKTAEVEGSWEEVIQNPEPFLSQPRVHESSIELKAADLKVPQQADSSFYLR